MRLPLFEFDGAPRPTNHIGEVIEADSVSFCGQCLDPEELAFPAMPALGSWVKARDEETDHVIYGVIYFATMAPIDSIHRARALGLSAQELREQQPQIFAMLKTEFRAAIVGFLAGERLYQYLPPRPPQIHQAVWRCPAEEVVAFCQDLEFLRTLLRIQGAPVDQLVSATIRHCYRLLAFDRAWLVQVGRRLSLLLKDDYDRLTAIIRNIQP